MYACPMDVKLWCAPVDLYIVETGVQAAVIYTMQFY